MTVSTFKQTRLVLAIGLVLAASLVAAAPGGIPGKPDKPKGETAGNNLSVPVIWSDGVAKALRGDFAAPAFYPDVCAPLDPEAPCLTVNGVDYFFQQEDANVWQAEWLNASIGESNNPANTAGAITPLAVDAIDWGDNLEARAWDVNSIVRVETVLYQDITAYPMTAFNMQYLFGQGPSEMQGTDKTTYASNEATVYSACARLTIQRLTKDRDDPTLTTFWNGSDGEWVGDVDPAVFNSGVWSAVEGSDSTSNYSAEINVGGKVIYGYNWRVRKLDPQPEGDWRLTFSLDDEFGTPGHCDVSLNTFFTDATIIRQPDEEILIPTAEGNLDGGVGVIDLSNNLTYIDVRVLPKAGGGNGGRQGNR